MATPKATTASPSKKPLAQSFAVPRMARCPRKEDTLEAKSPAPRMINPLTVARFPTRRNLLCETCFKAPVQAQSPVGGVLPAAGPRRPVPIVARFLQEHKPSFRRLLEPDPSDEAAIFQGDARPAQKTLEQEPVLHAGRRDHSDLLPRSSRLRWTWSGGIILLLRSQACPSSVAGGNHRGRLATEHGLRGQGPRYGCRPLVSYADHVRERRGL